MEKVKRKIVLEAVARHVFISMFLNKTSDIEWMDIEPILENLTRGVFGKFKEIEELPEWSEQELERVLGSLIDQWVQERTVS